MEKNETSKRRVATKPFVLGPRPKEYYVSSFHIQSQSTKLVTFTNDDVWNNECRKRRQNIRKSEPNLIVCMMHNPSYILIKLFKKKENENTHNNEN